MWRKSLELWIILSLFWYTMHSHAFFLEPNNEGDPAIVYNCTIDSCGLVYGWYGIAVLRMVWRDPTFQRPDGSKGVCLPSSNNSIPGPEDKLRDYEPYDPSLTFSWTIKDLSKLRPLVDEQVSSVFCFDRQIGSLYNALKWIVAPDLQPEIDQPGIVARRPPEQNLDNCGVFYNVLFPVLDDSYVSLTEGFHLEHIITNLLTNLVQEYVQIGDALIQQGTPIHNRSVSIDCPMKFYNFSSEVVRGSIGTRSCLSEDYDPSPASWNPNFDHNLAMMTQGGGVSFGDSVWWQGQQPGQSLSESLGQNLLGANGFHCSLESPCNYLLDCNQVGWRHFGWTKTSIRVVPSQWGFFVLSAFMNMNSQLSNQYAAIKGAAIQATLATFSISDFHPNKNQHIPLRNILAGLGAGLSLVSGLIPPLIPATEIAVPFIGIFTPTIAAIGAYFASKVSTAAPEEVYQASFASQISSLYQHYVASLSEVTTRLFRGDNFGNGNITDLMFNGAWLNSTQALMRVDEIELQLKIEILSRSIDQLWKTRPFNKNWVTFIDLNDNVNQTRCKADNTGSQALKACGDGGVYYTYSYIEKDSLRGEVDHPYGWDKLKKYDIEPSWTAEASGATYQLAKKSTNNLTLFNPDSNATSVAFLRDFATNTSQNNPHGKAGRFAGSWTIPVCNVTGRGLTWNYNWEKLGYKKDSAMLKKLMYNNGYGAPYWAITYGSPPCICGSTEEETKRWVDAAGLKDFQTYHIFCKQQLEGRDVIWPDGLESINYGFGDTIQRPK